MARETRAATGNSKPRVSFRHISSCYCAQPLTHVQVFPVVEEKTVTKKVTKPKTKANTTAKRTPATKGSKPTGVTKKKATVVKKTKTPTAGDVVKGAAKKVEGAVTKNPAKKVRSQSTFT